MAVVYRAEQVGSLLRPAELLQCRSRYAEGRLSLQELRSKEDEAIVAVLDKQRQIGIDILTDGELRRGSWLTDMADAVEGFVPQRVELEWKGPGGGREASSALAVGAKLRKTRHLCAHELPFLKKHADRPFKITLPAPSNFLIASYKEGVTDRFYPSRAELLPDLVEIINSEIQWLAEEGVRYVQLDAPYYSQYLDDKQRAKMRQAGRDPDEEFSAAFHGDNACLRKIPRAGLTVAAHICRGNSRSRWFTEGGYDAIAERLFGSLDVDTFLLEYDSERAGSFEPLRFVPPGKTAVLGLITTKLPELESQDALQKRIHDAARYISLDQLALSPQCGFASIAAGNLIAMDDQWRKLELVVETASKIWS